MARRHYDFNIKALGLFAALILTTAAGVILIYGGLYGFAFMGQKLSGAAQVMTAAANQPVGQALPQMGGGQGLQQQIGGGQGANQMGATGQGLQQGQGAGQYVCPQHGATGTPTFDANGIPLCPIDGQPMQFNPANSAPVR